MSDIAKVQLRLPDELHCWLVEWSRKNGRSMNKQVAWLIQEEKLRQQTTNKNPTTTMLAG